VNSGALFRIVAIAAAAAAAAVGFARGTYVAGGSDSYCYLSQAELFASWRVVNEQPLAAQAPRNRGAEAFIPVGAECEFTLGELFSISNRHSALLFNQQSAIGNQHFPLST
jgi:hypothetical protein